MYVINTADNSLDIVDFTDPTNPTQIERVDLDPYGFGINSVAVKDGLVAVAMEASPKTSPGTGVFFDLDGDFAASVQIGALPDMVTFSPDGGVALFANEGEPNSYNQPDSVDPEGSVSIVTVDNIRTAAMNDQTVRERAVVGTPGFVRGLQRRRAPPLRASEWRARLRAECDGCAGPRA